MKTCWKYIFYLHLLDGLGDFNGFYFDYKKQRFNNNNNFK